MMKCPWCNTEMQPKIWLVGSPMMYMGRWSCPRCQAGSSEIYNEVAADVMRDLEEMKLFG